MTMHCLHVVGARPNFMKAAPVMAALDCRSGMSQTLVHTGQHYDANMSEVFFEELGMPRPDVNLGVGSGSHARQTGEVMIRIEPVLMGGKPDWVIVYGDINSTAAATITAAKLGMRVAHVEAGLRSFDRSMPEELNRLITDRLATLLLTPSVDGDENLIREGVDRAQIRLVGNVMIDTLLRLLPRAETLWPALRTQLYLGESSPYALITLHRPANVDDADMLRTLVDALGEIARDIPCIFPLHPRTQRRMEELGIQAGKGLVLIGPQGYLEFLALERHATVVITDSGGIQEETTCLGVPCLTLRDNTERPITVSLGTNTLVGRDVNLLKKEVTAVLNGGGKRGRVPPLWDGNAGERIAQTLVEWQ